MKKNKSGLIIGVVVLAVLAGLYIILHIHNSKNEDSSEESKETTALEVNTDEIKEISFASKEITYSFSKNDDSWIYVEDESFPLDQDSFKEILNKFESVHSEREIENAEDLSEYGLDDPDIKVTIKDQDEKQHVLEFGSVNDTTGNCYVRMDSDDKIIYMVDSSLKDALSFSINDLAEKEEFPSITATTITNLTVEKPGEDTVSLVKDEESATGWEYRKGSSVKREVDSSKTQELLNAISGFTWNSFVTVDTDNLSSYGLENPVKIIVDYQITEEVEGTDDGQNTEDSTETITTDKEEILLLGNKDDSGAYYAKLDSQSYIYKIQSSSVEDLLNMDPKELVSNYVSNYIFADLDNVIITMNENSYEFTKKTEEKVKESSDDSNESDEASSEEKTETETVTTYYMNGNEISIEDFSNFYSIISGMECQEWLDNLPEIRDVPEFIITFNKENGIHLVTEYYSYDSNFYLVKDSKGNDCLVNKMKVKEFKDAFSEFLSEQNK